jgi:hypothetical protein
MPVADGIPSPAPIPKNYISVKLSQARRLTKAHVFDILPKIKSGDSFVTI